MPTGKKPESFLPHGRRMATRSGNKVETFCFWDGKSANLFDGLIKIQRAAESVEGAWVHSKPGILGGS
jgi:hypothetical protein